MVPVGPPARNLLLWIAGGIAAISLLGDAFGDTSVPWFWLAVLAVVALWYANRDKLSRKRGGPHPPPPAASAESAETAAPDAPTATARIDAAPVQTRHLPAPWAPGSYDPNSPIRPVGPRRPPLLFGRAIAIAALVVGVLGLIDVADWMPVPTSAYPAALLAVFGGFLVLGAFWGRAGGLVFLGLLALIALPMTMIDLTALETGSNVEIRPHTVAELESSYLVDAGAVVVDMSAIDPKTLDGRALDITNSFGEIIVIVPDGATVAVEATVRSLGEVQVFDETRSEFGGFTVERTQVADRESSEPGRAEDADLHLTATVDLGEITVYEESDPRIAEPWNSSERRTP
jgi:hypothetical protein